MAACTNATHGAGDAANGWDVVLLRRVIEGPTAEEPHRPLRQVPEMAPHEPPGVAMPPRRVEGASHDDDVVRLDVDDGPGRPNVETSSRRPEVRPRPFGDLAGGPVLRSVGNETLVRVH
jgi:hypothetical protein